MIFLFAIFCFAPMVLLGVYLELQLRRRNKRSKEPFPEKRLRSAGESTSERSIDEFQEFIYTAMMITLTAFSGFFSVWTLRDLNLYSVVVVLIAVTAATFWFGHKLVKRVRTASSYRLGAEGERVVGEQLMRDLLPKGFMVYHDLILDPNYESNAFNIDHVVVGPTGVFVIETKTRSKQREAKRPVVKRKGDKIMFADFADSATIPQVQRASNELKKFLGPCLPDRNRVDWAIAVPGWWTQGLPQTDQVMNHKMLARFISERRGNELSANDVAIISQMVSEKNRIEPVKKNSGKN